MMLAFLFEIFIGQERFSSAVVYIGIVLVLLLLIHMSCFTNLNTDHEESFRASGDSVLLFACFSVFCCGGFGCCPAAGAASEPA